MLPHRLWDALTTRLDESEDEPWDRPDELVPSDLVDMVVRSDCRLVGQTVEDAGLRHLPGLYLIQITRGGQALSPVRPDEILRAIVPERSRNVNRPNSLHQEELAA